MFIFVILHKKSNKTFEAGVRFGLTFALDKMNELEGKDKE